ncbi:MAG: PA2169 family four-helix-bundle protein [Chitinivibrionales bacterium]|nr:PA2169 family four-helix-bundle protein [Chitinivibrionales bacterium]MBD3358191.1 PA2169 family four-helix-bundle protein [Chitinivibrionales bacterium]
MNTKEVADKLNSLIQLDIDAVNAYDQAIARIKEPDIRGQLENYRDDHKAHIASLTEIIEDLGEQPIKPSKDFKGFLIQGFTMIRSMVGTESALQAMESNEKVTNKKYAEAMDWDLSNEIHEVITMNYQDEKEHLAYIQRQLGHEVNVEQYHGI